MQSCGIAGVLFRDTGRATWIPYELRFQHAYEVAESDSSHHFTSQRTVTLQPTPSWGSNLTSFSTSRNQSGRSGERAASYTGTPVCCVYTWEKTGVSLLSKT